MATVEERKIVTVLFCDLVGFTALSDQADPEDVRATLLPYHARVRQEIERLGGTVEKFIGDAVMAVYGAPVAHEDDPERAVHSALYILTAIEELNTQHPKLDLAVRVGINTGEAVVTLGLGALEREGMVAGDVVNTASRLQTVAPIGGAVVGEATFRATRHLFEYEELEPVSVKGKARPLPIWRVRARSRYGADVDLRPPTPFVGREDELEMLKRMHARSLKERSAQLVTLIGEPGVGKSRLLREFFAHIDSRPDLTYWRQGRCLSYGEGITFWALGEVVKAQAGILESDPSEEAAAKLAQAVGSLIEDPSERDWVTARLAPLIGVVPSEVGSAERVESFSAWRRLFEAMAAIHPLILAFEDLHWADPAMVEFVEHLVDWSTDVPILVVCTARPELFERHPGWGGGKRNSNSISLAPLSDQEIGELIGALLPPWALPDELHELLLERAEGNPLYAEEFARMVADQQVAQDGGAAPGLDRLENMAFPESIQAIIAARLDTLPSDRKALLQDASVVGRTFWSGALAFMGGIEEGAVRDGLHELTRKELVRPARTSAVKDQIEYAFWHVLVRDVAYSQIARASRSKKHRLAAEWTEALAGERVADHAELLVYHYRQSLDLARAAGILDEAPHLEESARRFLVVAGDRALQLDSARALEHYMEALELTPEDHADRGRILAKAAEAAGRSGRFVDAERAFEEAIDRFQEGGRNLDAGDTMVQLSVLLWHRGETARSRSLLGEAIARLESDSPGPELVHAYTEAASDKMVQGLWQEAVEWAEKALSLAENVGGDENAPNALTVRGLSRSYLGDQAGIEDIRRALELSLQLGLTREAARAQSILGDLLWATEGPPAALEAYRLGIEIAERRGTMDMAMGVRAGMLAPLFDLGRWAELQRVAEQLIRWAGPSGGVYFSLIAEAYKSQVLLLRGSLAEAAALADSFLPAAREIRDPQVLVIAQAVAAQVRMARGEAAAALEIVKELEEDTRGQPGWYRALHLPDLARICVAAGDLALGETLARDLPVHAVRHRISVLTAEAILVEGRGQMEEAAERYERAAQQWANYGHVLERGRTLFGLGRCRFALGRGEASSVALQARDIFAGLEATPLVAEADSLLEQPEARIR